MRHVVRQPAHHPVVEGFRHTRSGAEGMPGQLFGELGQMVFHGHVFGTEVADFPPVPQAEAQDEFVDEF